MVSGGALQSRRSPVAVILCLITCTRGPLDFTGFPHLSVVPLWLRIVLTGAPHRSESGHRDNESSPTAEFISSKGFCFVRARVYSMSITYTHTRDSNSTGDVLTIRCHVYNSTSKGFSVMKKDACALLDFV